MKPNLKRNQAKCQVLVAEAGEAKSSAVRFGSQMPPRRVDHSS